MTVQTSYSIFNLNDVATEECNTVSNKTLLTMKDGSLILLDGLDQIKYIMAVGTFGKPWEN